MPFSCGRTREGPAIRQTLLTTFRVNSHEVPQSIGPYIAGEYNGPRQAMLAVYSIFFKKIADAARMHDMNVAANPSATCR